MVTRSVAGWYADPTGRFDMRYWNGTAWTEHVSQNNVQSVDPAGGFGASQVVVGGLPEIRPGQFAVWATAVLSLSYFSYWSYDGIRKESSGFTFPLGILFMVWCWRLVARAHREYEALGLPLPQSYQAARIVATAFGILSVVIAIMSML